MRVFKVEVVGVLPEKAESGRAERENAPLVVTVLTVELVEVGVALRVGTTIAAAAEEVSLEVELDVALRVGTTIAAAAAEEVALEVELDVALRVETTIEAAVAEEVALEVQVAEAVDDAVRVFCVQEEALDEEEYPVGQAVQTDAPLKEYVPA